MPNLVADRVILELSPAEYQAILCSLEASVANGKAFPKDLRDDIRETWERLIVEGGHISPKQLTELRKLGQ